MRPTAVSNRQGARLPEVPSQGRVFVGVASLADTRPCAGREWGRIGSRCALVEPFDPAGDPLNPFSILLCQLVASQSRTAAQFRLQLLHHPFD